MLGEAERCCHGVRFETRRCVKMRLWPGLRPLHGGAYSASPDSLAGFGEGNGEGDGKG